MLGNSANVVIKILSDAKDGISGLDKTEGKLRGLAKVAGGAVVAGVAAGGAALVGLGVAGGAAASDLEQSVGAIDAIFKGNADQMHAWADAAAQDVGLTKDQFNGLGTLIGAQLKNGGTAMEDLAPKTNELIGLGSDLASMFGGDTASAVEALSSALKGERDPIERYGVSLNQAAIDAKAAELGFEKVGGALSAEANQAATLALIMEQTTDAHGNFAKESETVAGQQQRLVASAQNLVAQLGMYLLPVLLTVFGFLNDTAVPAVGGLIDAFAAAGGGGGLAAKLGLDRLQPILTTIVTGFASLVPVVVNFVTGVLVPGAQQIAANVAPILLALGTTVLPALLGAVRSVIPTVLGLAAHLIQLGVVVSARLAPIVMALLPVVVTVFGAVANVVKGALTVVSNIVRTVTAVISGDWAGAWDGIKGTLSAALALIETAISGSLEILHSMWTAGLDNIVAFMADLPGRLLNALGDLGGLLTGAGEDLVRGFLGGIGNMASAAADKAREVATGAVSAVKRALGIASPSRVFRELGMYTGQGLVLGLERQQRQVERAAGDLLATPDKLAQRMSPVDVAFDRRTSLRAGATDDRPTLIVQFHGVVDKVGAAREIENLLVDYRRLVGTPG